MCLIVRSKPTVTLSVSSDLLHLQRNALERLHVAYISLFTGGPFMHLYHLNRLCLRLICSTVLLSTVFCETGITADDPNVSPTTSADTEQIESTQVAYAELIEQALVGTGAGPRLYVDAAR